jgi:hypothetical protein
MPNKRAACAVLMERSASLDAVLLTSSSVFMMLFLLNL